MAKKKREGIIEKGVRTRRERMDEAIDGPKSKSYEDDFDAAVEKDRLKELKKRKQEILKGVGSKSEAEKKQAVKELREILAKIEELES